MRWLFAALGFVVVLLACNGGSPSRPASPSAAASASSSASPAGLNTMDKQGIERLATVVYFGLPPGQYPMGCNVQDRMHCPVTDRLAKRMLVLAASIQNPGPPNLWCRCQNPSSKTFAVVGEPISADSGIAHVILFDPPNQIKLDLAVVVGPHGAYQVDD